MNVTFESGSDELTKSAKSALDDVSSWMSATPSRTVRVVGFTDQTGEADANAALSARRAEAAKRYLASRGVDPSRITTAARGEAQAETSLPASGRTVTLMGCAPTVAEVAPTAGAGAPEEETPPSPRAAQPIQPLPSGPYESGSRFSAFRSRFGFAMLLGGGYEDFTSSSTRSFTSGGGSWDARVVVGTRFPLGAEVAYVGSANNVAVLGGGNSTLQSNGLEGVLRLNLPLSLGASLFEPFAFGGLGWAHYNIPSPTGAVPADFTAGSDNVMTSPVGAGLAWAYKIVMVDVRGIWTPTYFNNLFISNTSSGLNTWGVRGHVGVTF